MSSIARQSGTPRTRPRAAMIEWIDPLMAGGNWMPELVQMAGGENLFGAAGIGTRLLPPTRMSSWCTLAASSWQERFTRCRCLSAVPAGASSTRCRAIASSSRRQSVFQSSRASHRRKSGNPRRGLSPRVVPGMKGKVGCATQPSQALRIEPLLRITRGFS